MRYLDEQVMCGDYNVDSNPIATEMHNGKCWITSKSESVANSSANGSCRAESMRGGVGGGNGDRISAPISIQMSSNVGQKFDGDKVPMELLSPVALEGTAKVLCFGARKYARDNWRKGIAWTRIIGAIMRHITAIMRGEDIDNESGLPHVDHLGCEIMFLQEFYHTRKDLDDRYTTINKTNKE